MRGKFETRDFPLKIEVHFAVSMAVLGNCFKSARHLQEKAKQLNVVASNFVKIELQTRQVPNMIMQNILLDFFPPLKLALDVNGSLERATANIERL